MLARPCRQTAVHRQDYRRDRAWCAELLADPDGNLEQRNGDRDDCQKCQHASSALECVLTLIPSAATERGHVVASLSVRRRRRKDRCPRTTSAPLPAGRRSSLAGDIELSDPIVRLVLRRSAGQAGGAIAMREMRTQRFCRFRHSPVGISAGAWRDRGSQGGEQLPRRPALAIVRGSMTTRPRYIVESVHALPGSSAEYELEFRAKDGTTHRLVGSIERTAEVTLVTFEPNSPVFAIQDGDDPRPISRLVAAFDQARRGDVTGWRESEALEPVAASQVPAEVTTWATVHFDGGGLSPGPVTSACTVELSDGSVHEYVKRFDRGTHNTAEWQALILGLRMALEHGARHVMAKGDSLLVVKQINGEWKTKNAALLSLRAQAEELLALFESWRVEWIPRKENRRADALGRAR
jgi:ribonuclease HI